MDDQQHGYGVYKYFDNEVYEGEWKEGNQHGRGIWWNADGSVYHDGEFIEGDPVSAVRS